MACQQNKKSHSKKGMRRSHHHVDVPAVVYCSCGQPSMPHRACAACGSYRGRKIAAPADEK